MPKRTPLRTALPLLTKAEIDALKLPDDLAHAYTATYGALDAALELQSLAQKDPNPTKQGLDFIHGVLNGLEDRLREAKAALLPVHRKLIDAHQRLPAIAGFTGDCGHDAALTFARELSRCTCLAHDEALRLRKGGVDPAREWRHVRPSVAEHLPPADPKVLVTMMRREAVAATTPPARNSSGTKRKGKRIDEKMMAVIRDNQEALCWSSPQWKENLDCSGSTIKESKTWKKVCLLARERERLARGKRLRRQKPR